MQNQMLIVADEKFKRSATFQDQLFDLKGLSLYSSLKVPTLRDHIKNSNLPCFRVVGKLLIRKSEFDKWLENYRVRRETDINGIVDEVMKELKD